MRHATNNARISMAYILLYEVHLPLILVILLNLAALIGSQAP